MSNVHRYRYGNIEGDIEAPVASATVVEIGDFVCVVNDLIVPASSVADAGDAAANREAVADAFCGIAKSASKNGDTDPVIVGQEGVFELDQKTAAAIGFGDPVEIYASDTAAEDQTVVEGATSPIAVCIKTHDDTTTKTLCKLLPSAKFGTPQA